MIALWPFYFVTMEQYYTGEMNFPPINGVDEGSLVITGLSFISAYYGNVEFWTQQIDVPGMGKTQLNQGVTYIIILVIYAYGLSGLVNIYYGRHLAHFKAIYKPQFFVAQMFFYFFNVYTWTMMQLYSPTKIWETHPRTIGTTFGFIVVYVLLRMQYSCVIHAQVNPFRRSILLIWVLQWVNIYHMAMYKTPFFK